MEHVIITVVISINPDIKSPETTSNESEEQIRQTVQGYIDRLEIMSNYEVLQAYLHILEIRRKTMESEFAQDAPLLNLTAQKLIEREMGMRYDDQEKNSVLGEVVPSDKEMSELGLHVRRATKKAPSLRQAIKDERWEILHERRKEHEYEIIENDPVTQAKKEAYHKLREHLEHNKGYKDRIELIEKQYIDKERKAMLRSAVVKNGTERIERKLNEQSQGVLVACYKDACTQLESILLKTQEVSLSEVIEGIIDALLKKGIRVMANEDNESLLVINESENNKPMTIDENLLFAFLRRELYSGPVYEWKSHPQGVLVMRKGEKDHETGKRLETYFVNQERVYRGYLDYNDTVCTHPKGLVVISDPSYVGYNLDRKESVRHASFFFNNDKVYEGNYTDWNLTEEGITVYCEGEVVVQGEGQEQEFYQRNEPPDLKKNFAWHEGCLYFKDSLILSRSERHVHYVLSGSGDLLLREVQKGRASSKIFRISATALEALEKYLNNEKED